MCVCTVGIVTCFCVVLCCIGDKSRVCAAFCPAIASYRVIQAQQADFSWLIGHPFQLAEQRLLATGLEGMSLCYAHGQKI